MVQANIDFPNNIDFKVVNFFLRLLEMEVFRKTMTNGNCTIAKSAKNIFLIGAITSKNFSILTENILWRDVANKPYINMNNISRSIIDFTE
ncbi:hypothetical protein ACMAY7_06220 [Rhodobacteraceae bacterium nBUS_24]